MNELEQKILDSLIERKAEEIYQNLQKPEYQKIIREATIGMAEFIAGDIIGKAMDPEEKEEFLYNFKKKIDDNFSSKRELKQMGKENAREYYALLQMVNEENLAVKEFISYNNLLIRGLLGIAQTDGLERALTEEAEHEIIRIIHPTKNEYLDYFFRITEINDELERAINEIGLMIGETAYRIMRKDRQLTEGPALTLQRQRIYEKAEKIYGGKNYE